MPMIRYFWTKTTTNGLWQSGQLKRPVTGPSSGWNVFIGVVTNVPHSLHIPLPKDTPGKYLIPN
jgi:hypothetical protein